MATTKPIPANSSESKLESPGNAVASPPNDFGFVVNGNLNYWSLFSFIPLLAAIMAKGTVRRGCIRIAQTQSVTGWMIMCRANPQLAALTRNDRTKGVNL
ncbi:hypothetical protein HUN01_33925 [Nostoc edaphicum CCNP1411]|uniref:Uncharacterized protein n=1 Tax=Nostoc edaphicum CCNP1411 TaxID=1472755 RepID=A0A7D7RA67_9NOSO|nr:hypothetical protein [Nostoc edaphicum]QMS92346.1 hypothetical protein HUN01_33925 [Nostoc edaphicum CCNP1411]